MLYGRLESAALADLEHKGLSTVQTLAKDYELVTGDLAARCGAGRSDLAQTDESNDDEIRYIAITKGREVICGFADDDAKDEIGSRLDQYFASNKNTVIGSDIRRYTESFATQKSPLDSDPLLGGEGKSAGRTGLAAAWAEDAAQPGTK